jgi:sphingomyelin phosphodiesterase 4
MLGNVSAIINVQISELEGSRYHYCPLFSTATRRLVFQLLESVSEAMQSLSQSSQNDVSGGADSSWTAWLFGTSIDYNTSRYVHYDSFPDMGTEARSAEVYLEQAAVNLSIVFQVERPVVRPQNGRHPSENATQLAPDVTCVNGVSTLSPLGRYQLMNGLRKFEIEYLGDPDTQPIRSYESVVLVRMLYAISCFINTRFASQIEKLYHRDDFIGRLVRPLLIPSVRPALMMSPDRVRLLPPIAREHIKQYQHRPHVSLRWLASYQTIGYLLATYMLLYVWRGSGLLVYFLVLILLGFIYCFVRAYITVSAPTAN